MLDGFVLRKVVEELQTLKSEHLRQVYQYGKFTVYLYFESGVVRVCLEPPLQHVCLTDKEDFSDHHPSSFVMLLRSRLRNARLTKIEQFQLDRILIFTLDKIDEIGQRHEYKLYAELFGSHSNVILVENDMIVDCFRETKTDARQVLKGEPYTLVENRLNPLEIGYEGFPELSSSEKISAFLQNRFYGFSKTLINEILNRAGLTDLQVSALSEKEKALLKHSFFSLLNDFRRSNVCIYSLGEKFVLSAIPLTLTGGRKVNCFENPSEAVDQLYITESNRQKLKRLSDELKRIVGDLIKKEEKLIELLHREILGCSKKDEYLRLGELLKYASEKDKQRDQALVFDWTTGEKVLVPLVNGRSVRESSQHYFELYKKLKEKQPVLELRMKQAVERLDHLLDLKNKIETCEDLETLQAIKNELLHGREKRDSAKPVTEKSSFRKFEYEGFTIFVGKNNKQNEQLLRRSKDKDIWLHVHESTGAHVLIKVEDKTPSESVIKFAASLAAYYSNARYSSNVPVDYTEAKNVYKPKGSLPGMVLYTNFQTVFVDPLSVERIIERTLLQ